METTKKIAIACFIGGALCCAVALYVSPAYWWLGLLAGLAGGYLSYEFREVLKAIPIAMRKAGQGVSGWGEYWSEKAKEAKDFFAEPHPFLYLGIFVNVITTAYSFQLLPHNPDGVVAIFIIFLICLLYPVLFYGLAEEGAKSLNYFWRPNFPNDHKSKLSLERLEDLGYTEKPLTYLNAYHWLARGLVLASLAIGQAVIRWLWIALRAIGLFFWHLFKLIHSEKRMLCAIDGTLGGAIAYVWLHSPAMPLAEQVALVIFSGLLGAAFGVLNWEFVSKRILHVAPETST